jgi:RimJ/RimL family protein N-acetyltransferase
MTPKAIGIPELETERLLLRAPVASDFEPFVLFRMSERAHTVGGPYSRAQAYGQFCELFGHWFLRGYGRWVVADRDTDGPLGVVGLWYPEGWPEPEIAWSFFGDAEGKGIAFEAAQAARDFAYATLGWATAASLIIEGNERSFSLARRLNAHFESTFQHPELGDMQVWRHPGPSDLASPF